MTTKKTTTKKKITYKDVWNVLSQVDCSEHTEDRGGLTYLPWAWAMGIMMEHFPDYEEVVHENESGIPCFLDINGHGWVKVTVDIDGLSRTEKLPVLNHAHKPIVNPDNFQTNKAIKRCFVKCLAKFGLGFYLFAGEDLPQGQSEPVEHKPANKTKTVAVKTNKRFVPANDKQNVAIREEFKGKKRDETIALRQELLRCTNIKLPKGVDQETFKLTDIDGLLSEEGAARFLNRPTF
jgi:hypothetical protein